MSGNDDSFLARWARRKREAAAVTAPAPPEEAKPPQQEAPVPPEDLEARLAALPRLEEIGPDTDIRAFLDDWVPAALRNAALRRTWSSDARIANFIEVADYQWNWNIPDGMPGCGPLEPGFDTAAEVRRLFRETLPGGEPRRDGASQPADRKPEPDAASQENAGEDTAGSPNAVPGGEAKAQHYHEYNPDPSDAATQQCATEPPPRLARRHGGALPT